GRGRHQRRSHSRRASHHRRLRQSSRRRRGLSENRQQQSRVTEQGTTRAAVVASTWRKSAALFTYCFSYFLLDQLLLHSAALAWCVMRKRLRHLRDIPRPGCEQCRAFVDLVGNHFVEGISLAVVRLTIVRGLLHAEVSRHALVDELHVIGGAKVARAERLEIEDLLQRTINLFHQRRGFVFVFEGYAEDFAGSGVMNQSSIHFGNLGLVILHEQVRTDAALLFSGKQDERDCALRLPP